jgi:tRNA (guanine26-N2/guanine27-N2)-dimethyltransferase
MIGSSDSGMKILDGLSATGLRAIRYAKEIPSEWIQSIVANDFSSTAISAIEKNLEYNNLLHSERPKISVSQDDIM